MRAHVTDEKLKRALEKYSFPDEPTRELFLKTAASLSMPLKIRLARVCLAGPFVMQKVVDCSTGNNAEDIRRLLEFICSLGAAQLRVFTLEVRKHPTLISFLIANLREKKYALTREDSRSWETLVKNELRELEAML